MSKPLARLRDLQHRIDQAEQRAAGLAQPDYRSMTDEQLLSIIDQGSVALVGNVEKPIEQCSDEELIAFIAHSLSISVERAARLAQ